MARGTLHIYNAIESKEEGKSEEEERKNTGGQ